MCREEEAEGGEVEEEDEEDMEEVAMDLTKLTITKNAGTVAEWAKKHATVGRWIRDSTEGHPSQQRSQTPVWTQHDKAE